MGRSVTVHVLDQTTGEHLTPPDVMLYRIGVPGETRAESNMESRSSSELYGRCNLHCHRIDFAGALTDAS